jgi:dihydrodipicolinate synthase/N-acetylneuraminate lyase
MLLHGIFPPITTPFYAGGEVHYKKLEHNVARYSLAPISGMVILGSTGEAVLLSEQERRDVLKCAREAAAPEKVLLAGTGNESAAETLRLTEYAAELGYDVAMVRTPHYYKSQIERPENMLAFYRFVADRSPLPVLLYNFPQATAYDIPAEVVIALAGHPNVIGLKESSDSLEKLRRMVEGAKHVTRTVKVTETFQAWTSRMKIESGTKVREKETGFQILVGAAPKFHELLQAGAVGGILSFADPAPTAMFEIYAAWKSGDQKLAQEKQKRIAVAATRVGGDLSIPGVKYACDLNGYYGGPVRLPLLSLTAEVKAEVERLMAEIKN